MKIGLVTCTPEKVKGFDLHVYYSKWADGQVFSAAKGMQNDVTVFCDAIAIRDDPTIAAVANTGLALRKNRRFNLPFDYVCPTNPQYRERVLGYIEKLNNEGITGITLNLYHFPDQEFCVCPRCVELWKQSALNWTDWRTKTITQFVHEARERVNGTFAVEIYPDPVLAAERFGLDLNGIGEMIDYFHVPLSSRDYLTNYWVDMIARDFVALLKKPVVLELSAEMPTDEKLEALLKTLAYVSRHKLDAVLLLVHDSENAEQVCRFAVQNSDFRAWLSKYNFDEINRIVDEWAKIY